MSHLGLYVHVPFCGSICNYCNFTRGLLDPQLKARFVTAVQSDIAGAAARVTRGVTALQADTIFFGGGTPSLLTPAEIGDIIRACHTAFDVSVGAEVTLEVNPETVTADNLSGFRQAGVNRVSIGVQSFRDDELTRLGRVHDQARARRAVADARAAGFDNLSIDLMMWLPGQHLGDWQASIDGLLEVQPDHASLYMLELYPNAPLRDVMARTGSSLAPDDDAAEMYEMAMDQLAERGLEQYEISNVARPGRASRHNLKYWTDGEWLGFGPGAHSTFGGARWRNVAATEAYLAAVESGGDIAVEHRSLCADDRWREAVITGLRLVDGIDVEEFRQKYGLDLRSRYGDHLRPHLEAGLVLDDGARLRLSRRGMLLANEVLVVFI
ncbi:MAG: radical SAM family heme chaperone HemW [Acidobacteriota bacterium]